MRGVVVSFVAALSVAVVTGCGGVGAAPSGTPAGTPALTVDLSAVNTTFQPVSLSVPAGVPFAISFNNRDGLPHNVSIVGGPAGTRGDVFSGPQERVYVFPALAAGSYMFHCDIHPQMTGTIEAT